MSATRIFPSKADYIVVDLDSSIATAEGLLDSVGKLAGIPEFKMGEESFTAEKMRYNFVKRKGIIYNALTKEGDLTIHGEKTKFVAGGLVDGPDDDILYGYACTDHDLRSSGTSLWHTRLKSQDDT